MKDFAAASLIVAIAAGQISESVPAQAEIKIRSVECKIGDATFEGYMALDDAIQGKRPGILVVHDWTGVGNFMGDRVEALAKLGYVAFAPASLFSPMPSNDMDHPARRVRGNSLIGRAE
jgi:dienelactone hydrolase